MNSPVWWRSAISHHSVLLIFHRSLFLRLSELQISALCQAWTYSQILVVQQQRKLRVRLKENLLGQLRKRKSNRPLNPKPIGLLRMLFLALQKDGREGFAGIQFRQTRTLTQVFLSMKIRRKNSKTLTVSTVLVVSLREGRIRHAKYLRWAYTLLADTEGRFYLWALSGIYSVLFLVCIFCICIFLKLCNYSLCFLCKLFTSPNQEHVCA